MQKFEIRILKKSPHKYKNVWYQPAKITIGNFWERFLLQLSYWNVEQYKKQWREGIVRFKNHDQTCLIDVISYNQQEGITACGWVLYKEKDVISIQYHFLTSYEETKNYPLLNSQNCYLYIRPKSPGLKRGQFKI